MCITKPPTGMKNAILKSLERAPKIIPAICTPHFAESIFQTRSKTLQRIMEHSSLQMTMNLYCHVSDDKLFDEMKKMEK